MKPFSRITIQIVPHQTQRYDTCGDWYLDDSGNWHIVISDLGDARYNLLIALHELVEMALCCEKNITPEIVDRFDMNYQGKFPDEPGIDPKAPYHLQHMAAMVVEKDIARKLHVGWQRYCEAIAKLPELK